MLRYATTLELEKLPDCRSVYAQTEKVEINNNLLSNQESNQQCSPTFKKRKISGDQNRCRKCNIIYGNKTDDHMDSVWVHCEQRGCSYWVHLRCLGFVIQEESMK